MFSLSGFSRRIELANVDTGCACTAVDIFGTVCYVYLECDVHWSDNPSSQTTEAQISEVLIYMFIHWKC